MEVLVVDDEKLVSSLIVEQLKTIQTIKKIFFDDGNDVISKINDYKIRLVFLDLYLPELKGFDLLKKIKENNDNTKVIILSSHFDNNYIDKALSLGANGYLSKNIIIDEIEKSIEYVIAGKIYLSADCKNYSIIKEMDFVKDVNRLKEELSSRELEVLVLISDGLNSNEIAEKLYVSKNTVDFHKKSLFKKFGTNKATKIVKIATNYNII